MKTLNHQNDVLKETTHRSVKTKGFKELLKDKMDTYVHLVYSVTRLFPQEEMYSSANQWRRAVLSVVLNYIEGYARKKPLVQLNFFEISYGSLQESKYLLEFAVKEEFLREDNDKKILRLADEIGAMLWTEISALEKAISEKEEDV